MRCGKCNNLIPKEDITFLPPYWDCKCGNRNQKHIAETWTGKGEISLKDKKISRIVTKTNTAGERSIIYRSRDGRVYHWVVDKEGNMIHKPHIEN